MQTKTKHILSVVLLVLLFIQPLLDMYMAVIDERWDVFGISLATIARTATFVVLLVIVVIYQIRHKYKIKWLIALFSYLLIIGIYATCHHFNISFSNGYFIREGIYNVITELMYVLRLVVPVGLIYLVIIIKPEKKHIERTIISVVLIISLLIILTNIFKTSFASYSPTNDVIKYNVFDWFTCEEIPYKQALAKGLFVSANQIGALLTILLPIVILYILKYNNVFTYVVYALAVISMIMVGTRVASYGFILATVGMIIINLIVSLIKKEKIKYIRIIVLFLIMILGTILFNNSPAKNRVIAGTDDGIYLDNIDELLDSESYIALEDFKLMLNDESRLKEYLGDSIDNNVELKKNEKMSIDELKHSAMCKYIKENYTYHSITHKYVMDIYPYTEDPEFWLELFEKPVADKKDNRYRQSVIIKRIKELNNNILLDTLLGMGATPMNSRGYMIENDIISHYYNIGVIGMFLFIVPYALIILYFAYELLKHISKKISIRGMTYIVILCATYCIGFYAGHVIDEYIITIYVAIIAGMVVNYINSKKENLDERSNA